MIKFIIKILIGAPLKAWLFLFYLIHIGIKAIKPQSMRLPQLLILPLVVIGFSIADLLTPSNHIQPDEMWNIYLISGIVGAIIGWLIYRNIQLIVDRAQWLVTLPGGYITLILLLSIFLLNYFWGYMEAAHPNFFTLEVMHLKIASSGMLSGLSIGRLATYLYKFFKSK